MSQWQPPRPTEIDKKLRDDFRRLLKEYGVTAQETDPILAVLLRSFAAQIAEVYEQAAEGFAERYLAMLAAGGTKHHSELLKPFGLDARDPAFWQGGLGVIERMIGELEGLE